MKRRDRNIFFYLAHSSEEVAGRTASRKFGMDRKLCLVSGTTASTEPGRDDRIPSLRIVKRVEESKLHLVKVSVVQ